MDDHETEVIRTALRGVTPPLVTPFQATECVIDATSTRPF